MTTLQWLATEMKTGKVIADLPDLDVKSITRTIGRYETATATLPIPTAPENWLGATSPGGVTMVLLQDDMPIYGAFVSQRTRSEGDTANLSLVTLEGYMDRRYVGDMAFTATGQNTILTNLVNAYVVAGANGGIPLRIQVDTAGVGKLRDKTYTDISDKTVYSCATDLMGINGGVEWTIEFEHLTNPERYTPVLHIGDRIGQAASAGLAPAATFDLPGSVSTLSFVEDYSSSKGATSVVAVSTADGATRPQSPAQVAADSTRPTFEYRWTPSTSIETISTLTAYATKTLAGLSGGTTAVALSAAVQDAPKIGVDWMIGDDVQFVIGGLDANGKDLFPSFPGGMTGTARAIGWQMDISDTPITTPVLAGSAL